MENGDKIYDNSKEDFLWAMVRDFYNKKMLPIIILLWAWAIILIATSVWSGIGFYNSDQVKSQIMYTVIFVCCIQFFVLVKIFAWQMIHRNGIKREIKRLELRIAELTQTIKTG